MNEQILTSKEQRRILWRLLAYMGRYKKEAVLAFALLLLATAGELAGPYLVKVFIDDYLMPNHLAPGPVAALAAAYIGVLVGKTIIGYFQLIGFQRLALYIIQALRMDVFSKVHRLGMSYFDRTPGGSIVSRVTNDTEAIKDMFISVLAVFVQNGLFVIGVYIAMFSLNAQLALFCLFIIPAIGLIMKTYRRYSSVFYQQMRERLSELNAKLNESLQGMAIIQAFRQQHRLYQEFAAVNEAHYEAGMKNIRLDGLLLRPALDVVYLLSIMAVLSFFGISALESPVEIGVLYAFVNYLERFFEPVTQMMMRLSLYQQAIVSASRVFALLDHDEEAPFNPEQAPYTIERGEIEFRDVSFSYDGKRDVLKRLSFTIRPGQTVAFVGHTGSGKSSIINLLMRFYEFDRGDILLDGRSIRDYSRAELRRCFGLVLQDPFLFYGTVKENIRMYNEQLSDEEIETAARLVQADAFIQQLPGGYDHLLAERGATLSSGQRQLLSFARTIAAKPKILVLDEATAHIDTETEEAIQTALTQMRKGRTTIAIAHRLSTIQDADQIFVLHRGEIVERGTHQQLLAQKGLYYQMYLLQNGLVDAHA
ncbi:multidrug ABC transporter ATP-binding protein [Geobacillus sp. 47C-IIb]|uniref:ABC transporter ATP-binding protein n=1 Tax=Geobacillus TaxID=129337 RepID=UPI0009BE7056|nr:MULTISPECIES: ABC transporter transmembrane domain-containing protein [Geobacillus]ARP42322.1 putative multidrug resistance ABC transporter ATP-binding/permease protein YheH [Geobacillus thermodenitrificans]ATO36339.1 multidrug ABC transporter ATP-binding protein [Geobacillus thermodenitrificans]MED3905301.1 ABC transporter transmembrane domain-containing protein [Geobacillus thermodenitrificans]OQP10145.1 multidrug ABC transporter ATP-binding protein [Geobacillus sp. 47C-IIb]QNU30972.1 ATP